LKGEGKTSHNCTTKNQFFKQLNMNLPRGVGSLIGHALITGSYLLRRAHRDDVVIIRRLEVNMIRSSLCRRQMAVLS
jgi:uncharacterized SAM-dependent methyltransferase